MSREPDWYENRLKAKVAARNAAVAAMSEACPLAIELLRPFIGRKVTLATAGFSKPVKDALHVIEARWPNVTGNLKPYVRFTYSTYNLWMYVKCYACPPEGGAFYQECDHILGTVQNHILTELPEFTPIRGGWSVWEVKELRDKVRSHRNQMQEAINSLLGFGEHDNS